MAQCLLSHKIRLFRTRIAQGWLLPLGVVLVALYLYGRPGSNAQALAAPTQAAGQSLPTPTGTHHDPPAPSTIELSRTDAALVSTNPQHHPQIVKLWGGYDPGVGLDFYARYDLLVSEAFTERQLYALRNRNPAMRVLYTGLGTYDTDDGPLGRAWISAEPNTPEYNCFYRGTDGRVLKVDFWDHGMFNMGDAWCRQAILAHTLSQVEFKIPSLYDGLFFDRIHQAITPILSGIDLDHNGRVDDARLVNEQYERGVKAFLDDLRHKLGEDLILVANDAPLVYTSRLNGREYESTLRTILDQGGGWPEFHYNYEQWMQASREPRLTMVMANPPRWMEVKYGREPWTRMRGAVLSEAAGHYQRMRFGLTSTLLEGGLYGYEFGTTWHGNAWWYDEYDNAGTGHGYLGIPLGKAYLAAGPLTTTNLLLNPGFETDPLWPWTLHVQDSKAQLDRVLVRAPFTSTYAARIAITATGGIQDVRLEQASLALTAQERLNLSFWARTSAPLWDIQVRLHDGRDPGTNYAGPQTLRLGSTWQHLDVPLAAAATISNAVLSFDLGGITGTVWIDEVALQRGTLSPVYRRDFAHGIVLCNPALQPQTIHLEDEYCKIDGSQAPRFKLLVDDSEQPTPGFSKTGGWAGHGPSDPYHDDCWGDTYHHALTTQDPGSALSSATWRPNVPYSDAYTISAWALPCLKCTQPVTYTIAHAAGITAVSVDVQVDEPAWIDLGTYPLAVGTGNSVTLTNLSQSEWVVADAVKFESLTRYNDGTCSSSIALDAQDGIILLRELRRTYLPLLYRGQ